jgi:tetratricopeptide (TPR) repeat protein
LGRPLNITTSISGFEKNEVIDQIKHFSASLQNKPDNLHEWIQLGNLRKIIGDYLGAIEYWKYASLLEPTYHVPYNNLGNLYQYYLNDMTKAEENYKKYIELSPQVEEPYKLLFDLYTISYTQKENLAQGVLEEGIKNSTHNNYLKHLLENYKKEKGIQ